MDTGLFSFPVSRLNNVRLHAHMLISVSLGGDLLAGITLAAMLIPQSVSYGTALARLSPATGLVRFFVSFLFISNSVS